MLGGAVFNWPNLVNVETSWENIFAQFHLVWRKIVDFLLVANFEEFHFKVVTLYSWLESTKKFFLLDFNSWLICLFAIFAKYLVWKKNTWIQYQVL